MKRLSVIFLCLSCVIGLCARGQWTEKQAWQWQEKMGVIKGFNEPYPAYPGQTLDEMLSKASQLGFNSVRFWVGGNTAEQQIQAIRDMINVAQKYKMTVEPVINYVCNQYEKHKQKGEALPLDECEKTLRQIIRAFANDKQIAFWDLWNEPRFEDKSVTYEEMDIIEKMVKWCREENPVQPITSSIIWATINKNNKALKRTTQVEAMMDIHNFHSYDCALNFGKNIYDMLDYLKSIGDRPMVATECLTRVNGSGLPRTLAAFAKYKVNFYIWGLYINDRNWEARWGRSTYDPYDPMFHNVLYSDGDMYDAREIELIRKYHFAKVGENVDPGIEITDRWSHERSWRWMVSGPVKGLAFCDTIPSVPVGYNAVSIKLNYNEWKNDTSLFFRKTDELLMSADKKGLAVMPVLLTDDDANQAADELGRYVGSVINRYYCDRRIKAWELYHLPGLKVNDTALLSKLITTVFRYARNQFANQPLTVTPLVGLKPFSDNFDYWGAMVHGRTAGWDKLEYSGGSTPDLVYKIWSLSDVTSFATNMRTAETGWLVSICYRFGRPIYCTSWSAPSQKDVKSTLSRFAESHVFWFSTAAVPNDDLSTFCFRQTSTQRQVTEGM
jgi:hypothetical protein